MWVPKHCETLHRITEQRTLVYEASLGVGPGDAGSLGWNVTRIFLSIFPRDGLYGGNAHEMPADCPQTIKFSALGRRDRVASGPYGN